MRCRKKVSETLDASARKDEMAVSRTLLLVLLLLGLIWGGSFYFIKELLNDFGPWTIACLRSGFGLATVGAFMLALRKPFAFGRIPWMLLTVVAVVNTALPWVLIGYGETRMTSSMASILNATTPLWTIIVGRLFFRGLTHRLQWIGMGIAFAGVLILLDINTTTVIAVDALGLGCMIAATLCYAFGTQLSRRLADVSVYQISFGTLLCSMIASGGAAVMLEPIPWPQLVSWSNLALLTGLGVFGSGIAYILFYFMIQRGSAEFATMVTYLVPASAIIWGSTLLDEPLHWNLFAGLALILGGVFAASRRRSAAQKTQVPYPANSFPPSSRSQ